MTVVLVAIAARIATETVKLTKGDRAMKIQRYEIMGNCYSDCENQEPIALDEGDLVCVADLQEIVGCLQEIRAYAISMEWLSESGEIEEDAPGWVSLLVHTMPENLSI
jgi:hypothetical protein